MTEDWPQRAARLADQLAEAGKLRSPQWQAAVRAVPRHALVPAYYRQTEHGWERADTSTPEGRARWLELVYSNTALFVLPDGRSSSSMPGLMTRMLEALDVHDGHRVLEIGTGTGYNAALLSHRLGSDNVFSVDVEPELIALARQRLAALGYHPTLAAVDGAGGLADHAPYDRVLATCAVPRIPWPWVDQTRPSGLILADLKVATNAGNLVLLRRFEDRAEGRFERSWGGFMPLRRDSTRPDPPLAPRDRSAAHQRSTCLDLPRPWENLVFWFLAQLLLPPNVSFGQTMNDNGQPANAYLAVPDGSWCEIAQHPDEHGNRRVLEAGPHRLWTMIEDAHRLWTSLGQPGWERFGLTVTPQRQRVWLDHPDGEHTWELPHQGTGPVSGPVVLPQLRAELLRRSHADQDARFAYLDARDRGEDADWAPVHAVDEDNLGFLLKALGEHGWLGSDLVGADGAHACWLLVQHAPTQYQDQWLPLMEHAVAAGTASASDLVYLQDRVNLAHNRPQTHGSQSWGTHHGPTRLWPVTDPANLNARRAEVGLPPLAEDTVADAWTAEELRKLGCEIVSGTGQAKDPDRTREQHLSAISSRDVRARTWE